MNSVSLNVYFSELHNSATWVVDMEIREKVDVIRVEILSGEYSVRGQSSD